MVELVGLLLCFCIGAGDSVEDVDFTGKHYTFRGWGRFPATGFIPGHDISPPDYGGIEVCVTKD